MIMFLDTETTGVPKKGWNWEIDFEKFPRVVSISWMNYFDRVTAPFYYIINREGFEIPAEAIVIHGITNEISDASRDYWRTIVPLLLHHAEAATWIVGQNIYFDTSIIKANILRVFGPGSPEAVQAIRAFDKRKRLDIMRVSAKMMHGWKTLQDIYFHLFKENYEDHHAEADVRALARVYEELRVRKIIKDPAELLPR